MDGRPGRAFVHGVERHLANSLSPQDAPPSSFLPRARCAVLAGHYPWKA